MAMQDEIKLTPDEIQAKIRAMTGQDRVAATFEMMEIARDLMLADVAAEHPYWCPERVKQQVLEEMDELGKNPPLFAEDMFNRDYAAWLGKLRPHRARR